MENWKFIQKVPSLSFTPLKPPDLLQWRAEGVTEGMPMSVMWQFRGAYRIGKQEEGGKTTPRVMFSRKIFWGIKTDLIDGKQ